MTEPGSKKTVGKLLSELEPHQLWTVVIALFASASALAGAGFNVGRFTAVSSAPAQVTALNDAPVPCHLATSWPMGGWWVWGRLENDWQPKKEGEQFPQLASIVRFDSNKSYTASPNRPTVGPVQNVAENAFEVRFSAPLQPRAQLRAEGSNASGMYKTFADLEVSADGCMLHGEFRDTDGNRGELHYLFRRDQYYVLAK